MKQLPKLDQQVLSKIFLFFVGRTGQEPDVANQMRQAELLKFVGMFDIGTEKVIDNCATIGLAQDFFEDFRRSRLGNTEKAEYWRTKDPCPILDAFIFPAGLLNIQDRLGWDIFLKFFIRSCKCLIETLDNITQMTASDVDIQDFTTKGLQAAIRSIERASHMADQCLQTRAEQLTFDDPGKQFSPNNSSAFGTDKIIRMGPKRQLKVQSAAGGLLNDEAEHLEITVSLGIRQSDCPDVVTGHREQEGVREIEIRILDEPW